MADGIDNILHNFDRYTDNLRRLLEAALTKVMLDLEAEAKANHPYQDDTGANTASIRGLVAMVRPDALVGVLSASMEYSAALELANGGKYAYLWPAIQRKRSEILTILREAVK